MSFLLTCQKIAFINYSTCLDPPSLRKLCDGSLSQRFWPTAHVCHFHFTLYHTYSINCDVSRPTLSYQRLKIEQPLSDAELHDKIRRMVPNKHELQVLESFLIFNKCVDFPVLPFILIMHVLIFVLSWSLSGRCWRQTSTSRLKWPCPSASRQTSFPKLNIRGSHLECFSSSAASSAGSISVSVMLLEAEYASSDQEIKSEMLLSFLIIAKQTDALVCLFFNQELLYQSAPVVRPLCPVTLHHPLITFAVKIWWKLCPCINAVTQKQRYPWRRSEGHNST